MTKINVVQPYSLVNAIFTIGDNEYSDHISQVVFNPSTSTKPWTSISGYPLSAVSPATWTCTIGFVQDVAPDGLLRFMLDHEGEAFDCTFLPLEDGPTIAATLTMSPAAIGGSADGSYVEGTATLGVQGKPQFIDPVAS
ncbi:hypothetical protein [Cellulomonas uda]|uniref:Uncharacterized protein n=1 Tax=Cellulomonas uda TaxID=1714 RepID=A0A4Y3KBN8_CELUD|nr:hypothetical protein [Cellulomonas uda]NII65561.1 hypothetical protein [Cellulomonas uda]GEA81407.1 hypothetical protein CUD01_18510 [Cellulomonas uda]